MSTQLENDLQDPFESTQFQHHLPQYYRAVLQDFRKIVSSRLGLHLLFLTLLSTEGFSIAFFFSFLSGRSAILAFSLGALFLTVFTYMLLLFYYQARLPEELRLLRDRFLSSCRQLSATPLGEAEPHLSIADALLKLSAYLQGFEWNFYKIPPFLQPFSKKINRFSAYFYGQDVFFMKQLLLQAAIDEHLKQVRISPTDLEVHASLANAYVALSRLFKDILKMPQDHPRAGAYRKKRDYFEEKFRTFSQLAIEEFKILNYYAPSDPWIHEQLASGYHELEMPEDEIREMELLVKLRPQNKDALFCLGNLYFEQGQNARGLQVYEELKLSHYKKAEDLIVSYGARSLISH